MRNLHTPKLLLAGALAVLAAAVPAPADAAEVVRDGSTLVLRGAPGENNYLAARVDDMDKQFLTLSDRTDYPMTADAASGCTISQTGFGRFASCPTDGIDSLRIEGADGNDELDISPHDLPIAKPVVLDGGVGNDDVEGPTTALPVIVLGGDGDDKVKGGQGPDVADGGAGNDSVDGNDGNDEVRGGDGDDVVSGGRTFSTDLIDGGPGRDTVNSDWTDTNQPDLPLRVTLDGVADDGRPGENDNALSIEVIETHRVATLIAGADPVEFSVTNTPAGSSTLGGSPGNDRLRASAYNDRVDGGGGADAIAAGAGDDTINGGAGPDTILADGGVICDFLSCSEGLQGNDTVEARDGEKDSIDCGPGTDTVSVDPIDVTSNCENVVGAAPVAKKPPAKKRKACVVPAIKRGTTLKAARKKLTGAGCKVKVRRVTSKKVRKGRVVGLTRKVSGRSRKVAKGKRLGAGAVVYVTVSRGRR